MTTLAPAGLVPLQPGQRVAFIDARVTDAGLVCDVFMALSHARAKLYNVGLDTVMAENCRQDLEHDDTRRSVIAWLLKQPVPLAWLADRLGETAEDVVASSVEWRLAMCGEWLRECLRWAYPETPEDAERAPAMVLLLLEIVAAERGAHE